MPPKPAYSTRGAEEHYLIGFSLNSLECGGKLPLTKNVLQYLKYCQSVEGQDKVAVKSLICCPLLPKSKTASCSGDRGCLSVLKTKCVVAALKETWGISGIPTISDHSQAEKIKKLYEEYRLQVKHKNRDLKADIDKRESLKTKLQSLFDIGSKDAVKIIREDRLRTKKAREADINFYEHKKG